MCGSVCRGSDFLGFHGLLRLLTIVLKRHLCSVEEEAQETRLGKEGSLHLLKVRGPTLLNLVF